MQPFSELLCRQAPACHWVVNHGLEIVYAAGRCEEFLGRGADVLPGRNFSECLPGAAQRWRNRIERVLEGESLLLRDTRGDAVFSVTLYPLRNENGQILYAAGVAQDITRISLAEQQLRNTILMALKAHESERGRLSRFLHDDVGQCLSSTGLHLDLLRMDLEKEVPAISERTANIQRQLEGVMGRVREFSYELNPDIVERAGLQAAMDRLVGRTRKRFRGNLRLLADSTLRVPAPVAAAFYKIAQEALNNAVAHAECSVIELMLKSTRTGPVLEVRDNGKGFDISDVGGSRRGLGLLIMEHSALEGGLDLSVDSTSGRGTVIRAAYESGRE